MSRATPQMRHFAKRLIVYETNENKSAKTKMSTPFPVPEKLRPHLVALMGNGGFQALLARALALAKTEVPWLRSVHVNASGSMEGLGELQTQLVPAEFLEGGVVLLAQLLGLLAVFIGENLTLRLVHEVWPKVPLDDLDLETRVKNETRGKNEKTK
jgi:hypothetical protein